MRVLAPVDTYVEPVVTASPRTGLHGSQLLRLCVGGSPPLCQYSMYTVWALPGWPHQFSRLRRAGPVRGSLHVNIYAGVGWYGSTTQTLAWVTALCQWIA